MATVIRVTLNQLLLGQLVQNVLHFRDSNEVYDGEAAIATIIGQWVQPWAGIQGPPLTYSQITVSNLDQPQQAPIVRPMSTAASSYPVHGCPTFLACVIRISTNVAGRHGRGRVYMAGVNCGHIENGLWNANLRNLLVQPLQTMREQLVFGGSHLTIGVFHKGPDNSVEFAPATDLQLRIIPGIQRRRNIGVGI